MFSFFHVTTWMELFRLAKGDKGVCLYDDDGWAGGGKTISLIVMSLIRTKRIELESKDKMNGVVHFLLPFSCNMYSNDQSTVMILLVWVDVQCVRDDMIF